MFEEKTFTLWKIYFLIPLFSTHNFFSLSSSGALWTHNLTEWCFERFWALYKRARKEKRKTSAMCGEKKLRIEVIDVYIIQNKFSGERSIKLFGEFNFQLRRKVDCV